MKHAEMSSRPSEGHISKLLDFHSLLIYRAGQVKGPEGVRLLAQAHTVDKNITNHLDRRAAARKKLTAIKDQEMS